MREPIGPKRTRAGATGTGSGRAATLRQPDRFERGGDTATGTPTATGRARVYRRANPFLRFQNLFGGGSAATPRALLRSAQGAVTSRISLHEAMALVRSLTRGLVGVLRGGFDHCVYCVRRTPGVLASFGHGASLVSVLHPSAKQMLWCVSTDHRSDRSAPAHTSHVKISCSDFSASSHSSASSSGPVFSVTL